MSFMLSTDMTSKDSAPLPSTATLSSRRITETKNWRLTAFSLPQIYCTEDNAATKQAFMGGTALAGCAALYALQPRTCEKPFGKE